MRWPDIVRRVCGEAARPLNLGIIVFWIAFVSYAVNVWGTSVLFDRLWWFDEIAHAAWGFGFALTLFYVFRRYAVRGVFNFAGGLFLSVSVIGAVTIFGMLWEGLELLFDLFVQPDYGSWLTRAQLNSVDTTLDLLTNTSFATLAMIARKLYDSVYGRLYPTALMQDDIEEMRARIEHLSRDMREQRRRYGPRFRLKPLRHKKQEPCS